MNTVQTMLLLYVKYFYLAYETLVVLLSCPFVPEIMHHGL
jgi:hypothetical protein